MDRPNSDPATLFWAPKRPKREIPTGPGVYSLRPSRVERIVAKTSDASGSEESGPVMLVSGDRLPNSRIEVDDRIGMGATAVVFRGRHVDLDRTLAIKVLKQGATWPGARDRFLAEARLTSELDSAYVVDVVDFGTLADGRMWSAMEFLDGRALSEEIDAGRLSPERTIALLRMACKGLHAAHAAGIVHRDIKPDNLMLIEKRGREQLVIVDFGIATSDGRSDGECCGTPRYMAPEQIRGEALDGRTDIYALGCCAYEMLTGELLVDGDSVEDVLQAHLDGIAPRFSEDSQVPVPLQLLVEQCLRADPAKRYACAAELEAALCEAQLAADLRCPTDALPLPDLEDVDRRRRLARGLARAPKATRTRRVVAGLAAALCLTFAGVSWADSGDQEQAAASSLDARAVQATITAAKSAAEDGHYVQLGKERTGHDYAYDYVIALERWDGLSDDSARAQAREFRRLFSEQLQERADALWTRDRGQARELYAQALVFDPTRTRARERVGMTDNQLDALRLDVASDSAPLRAALPPAPPRSFALPDSPIEPTKVVQSREAERTRDTKASEQQSVTAKAAGEDPTRASWVERQHARAEVRRGRRAARRSKHRLAREHFERAIELDPRRADAYGGLADLDLDLGRHRTALKHARAAVRFEPRQAEHRIRLGDCYLRVSQRSRAKNQYERAVALGSLSAKRLLAAL